MTEIYVFECIVVFLIAALTLLVGFIFIKHPPKKINGTYGYRTRLTMMNQDTWDYGHKMSGPYFVTAGAANTILAAAACVLMHTASGTMESIVCMVAVCLQAAFMIGALLVSNSNMKKTFDENGKRR